MKSTIEQFSSHIRIMNSLTDPRSRFYNHPAERIAFYFIDSVCNDKFASDVPEISVDCELSFQDRIAVFRTLERFIKSQEWNLWFTTIVVANGYEDSVDCYLRGTDGGLLVLLLGYHYDINEWRVDAYEIPERTFARPANESYDDYVNRSVSEWKASARSFERSDGRYFLQY